MLSALTLQLGAAREAGAPHHASTIPIPPSPARPAGLPPAEQIPFLQMAVPQRDVEAPKIPRENQDHLMSVTNSILVALWGQFDSDSLLK